MNRFRAKKKVKESAEGIGRASVDSDAPTVPTIKSSRTFRRGKKVDEPEPKLELDIANALPSSDDFRTSLLMSGLSARFSMLREQDDPKSKIGKASDDSVLYPRRQSRLNDFGFQSHGLSDIAEVSSVMGPIRPPFAFARTDSYNMPDGYGTDEDSSYGGSIMNRGKPGEGNNLFGGRQKIYKIPVGASPSMKSLADGKNSGMGGRFLYENDVSQSAFQKLRDREREQQWEREAEEQNTQSSRPESPPLLGYNRNRETSSTTSSAGQSITRSSTAATSFTSQRTPSMSGSHTPVTPASGGPGLDRSAAKGRRLYETGLDQHIHEQQHSAMTRIDTLTKHRALTQTPPPGLHSPGAPPVDRWDRGISGKASMPNLRAASPTLTMAAMGTFDFGVKPSIPAESTPHFGMVSPPLSPPMSENDDHVVLLLQPNDMGKATALGAFSKPVQPYDENKYSQRQLQMQQGRETPPLRKHSPPHISVPRHQQTPRTRADSNTTYASTSSRSNSSAQGRFLPQGRIPEIGLSPEPQITGTDNGAMNTRDFLSSAPRQNQLSSLASPLESQHPANRQQPFQHQNIGSGMQGWRSPSIPSAHPQPHSEKLSPPLSDVPADSPTLGPAGLSGMVRQHLRTDSNTSSIYGGVPSAGFATRFPLDPTEPLPQNEYSTKNNPWESDEWDQSPYENKLAMEGTATGQEPDIVVLPPVSARSPSNIGNGYPKVKSPWEKDIEAHHTRDGSSETQRERRDFKNELATRRRQVQEHMKSFAETESGSTSPLQGSDWSKDGLLKSNTGFKTKPGLASLVTKPKEAGQWKAMKMLGIGNATISSSPSPNRLNFDESTWKEEEEEMLRGVPRGPASPPQTKAFRQARRDARRDRERQVALRHQRKGADEAQSDDAERHNGNQRRQDSPIRDRVPPNIQTSRRTPSRERRPPPQSNRNEGSQQSKGTKGANRSGSREPREDRSSSDASGRSKSRNGRYRDDLAKAMAEGTASSSQVVLEEPPPVRLLPKSPAPTGTAFQPSPVPSPMIVASSAARSRSNSKSSPSGYFDSQKLQPLQTAEGVDIGLSPRPSPIAPFFGNPTAALTPHSPIGSAATTPVTPGFQAHGRIPTNRKKSINKSEISEPRFISSTSRVTTVDLPPGSSLQNGMEPPPIPPVNPRRRQTRVIFGLGKKDESEELHTSTSTEEMSTFSADEGEFKPKNRQLKLRKSSSEGGSLNAKAQLASVTTPSPAMPGTFPPGAGGLKSAVEGGMF